MAEESSVRVLDVVIQGDLAEVTFVFDAHGLHLKMTEKTIYSAPSLTVGHIITDAAQFLSARLKQMLQLLDEKKWE
jgi:diphthamide synthase subunit DPH2